MHNFHSFTAKYEGLSSVLTLPVKIMLRSAEGAYKTEGIIDTGATGSVISENIANCLKAIPQTYAKVNTASSQGVITPVYEASIELSGKVTIGNLMVTSGALLSGAECLIGMDILSKGDLAVTHYEGKTCVSFRVPSRQCIDFVEAEKASSPIVSAKPLGRNDLCSCGSGKKYKHCCGK